MRQKLQDELSAKQHAEFKVSAATDLRHRCWTVLTMAGTTDREEIKKWAKSYRVPYRSVVANIKQFKALMDQSG